MTAPNWFPDELARAGAEHLEPAYVAAYDRKSGTDPAEDVALLRAHGLNESSTLIDLGAGTGAFALAAAPYCRRVIAVDISPPMLRHLRQRANRLGIPNITGVQGGFLTYEHAGDPADFVYTRNALHHLPDFWKALALTRIAAMLEPGGVLLLRDLVYSFDPAEAEPVIAGWLAEAAEQAERGYTWPEFETHLREEFSTFSWLLEPMLRRAGFTIEAVSHAPSRTYSVYTCRK